MEGTQVEDWSANDYGLLRPEPLQNHALDDRDRGTSVKIASFQNAIESTQQPFQDRRTDFADSPFLWPTNALPDETMHLGFDE